MKRLTGGQGLLSPREAASVLGVDLKVLQKWAREGVIGFAQTLGGDRRYRPADVEKLLNELDAGRRP